MIATRTDVVGSLLRPRELLEARQRQERGEIGPSEFKRVEDAAVEAAIRLQEDAGLAVVTDGEMRRLSFQSQLTEAVDGFSDWDLDAFLWGDRHGDEVGDKRIKRPPIAVLDRLQRRRFLSAEEFVYARGRTERIVKVTLPSPSLFANFYNPERSRGAYPTLESFLGDVAEILREEVDELVRLGCEYIQLDAPHYPILLDSAYRDFYASRGWPAERWLDLDLELDNIVFGERPGVAFGFHLCRGNQQSRWLVEGGYAWLAQRLFPRVRAERLLLEYDDDRSGGFEPLAAVPQDKTVVLGLVTTKTGRQETVDELEPRIREAARHVPLERLALSAQCGFATSILGNALSLPPSRRPSSGRSLRPPSASGDEGRPTLVGTSRMPGLLALNVSELTMYTTVWCGYCRRLKAQLARADISFREVDIEHDAAAAEFVAGVNGGNQTVPTVLLPDGSVLVNPTIDQLIEATAA